ncbi:MAG: TfoX/Sxy family protein [Chloroflexota bacterium]|nr:TfoX/Sxy family protein [Chloroflexota bacterium]
MPNRTKPAPEPSALMARVLSLGDLAPKRMFGCECAYVDGQMIAVLHATGLYFKTDDQTRGRFDDMDLPSFAPSPRHGMRAYRLVPDAVAETDETLRPWLMDAVSVGKRQAAARKAPQN